MVILFICLSSHTLTSLCNEYVSNCVSFEMVIKNCYNQLCVSNAFATCDFIVHPSEQTFLVWVRNNLPLSNIVCFNGTFQKPSNPIIWLYQIYWDFEEFKWTNIYARGDILYQSTRKWYLVLLFRAFTFVNDLLARIFRCHRLLCDDWKI